MAERLVAKTTQRGQALELYESGDRNPEVFIDGVHGLMVNGATVKLNCFSRSINSTAEAERRDVACRLVMGVDTFFAVADFLNAQAAQLRKSLAKPQAKVAEKGTEKAKSQGNA
jgi:hypothetical protein